ncbi:hypothetical protein ACVIHB_009668 [Bradyrhizobium liaoningense]
MPCRVKECGRRGATGGCEGVLACVTRSSFVSDVAAPPASGERGRKRLAAFPYIVPILRIASAAGEGLRQAAGLLTGPLYALGTISPPPVQPDAVQFLSLHPAVPAGRAGRLLLARPAQQSGPGDLAGTGFDHLLCDWQLAVPGPVAGIDRVQLRRRPPPHRGGAQGVTAPRSARFWRHRRSPRARHLQICRLCR